MGDTIIDLKQIFLNNQIRILSTPLAPSQGWHDNAPIPEQGVLKDKTVQDAIRKGKPMFQTAYNENLF